MKNEAQVFPPGSTIGMLGGGQLGRMFALAAHRMGYRVVVLTDEIDSPASHVAARTIVGSYEDRSRLEELARCCDVITLEFENIAEQAARWAAELTPVYPSADVLRVAQHRRREKQTLADLGLPVTPFRVLRRREDLPAAAESLGLPLVLKTARSGYDGKGQSVIRSLDDWPEDAESRESDEWVAEKWIDFQREVSILVARNAHGEMVFYPLVENDHSRHILDVSVCPATDGGRLQEQAESIARRAAEGLNLIGLMCVEMFVSGEGELMINEIAPRPHNSGHLTIEAATTDQFEQQLRAVCGLPLGETTIRRPAAMVNLLGDLWHNGPPCFEEALRVPEASLHLYGKSEPRIGRKMGHITALGDTVAQARQRALDARAAIDPAVVSG